MASNSDDSRATDVSDVNTLLAEATELVQMYEYQAAVDKYGEAYNMEPENTLILDSLAEVLLEIGDVEHAQEISFNDVQG